MDRESFLPGYPISAWLAFKTILLEFYRTAGAAVECVAVVRHRDGIDLADRLDHVEGSIGTKIRSCQTLPPRNTMIP